METSPKQSSQMTTMFTFIVCRQICKRDYCLYTIEKQHHELSNQICRSFLHRPTKGIIFVFTCALHICVAFRHSLVPYWFSMVSCYQIINKVELVLNRARRRRLKFRGSPGLGHDNRGSYIRCGMPQQLFCLCSHCRRHKISRQSQVPPAFYHRKQHHLRNPRRRWSCHLGWGWINGSSSLQWGREWSN